MFYVIVIVIVAVVAVFFLFKKTFLGQSLFMQLRLASNSSVSCLCLAPQAGTTMPVSRISFEKIEYQTKG